MLQDIVAVAACRTAMGKFGGSLRNIAGAQLGATVIRDTIKRGGVSPDQIDEVILGSCRQAGNGPNPARTAMIWGGLSENVAAITLNMACPSGMRSVMMGAQALQLGEASMVMAGGFESMSNIPYLLKNSRWEGFKMGNKILEDGWSDSIDPLIGQGMGETAENMAEQFGISRIEMDHYAVESHRKAFEARQNGLFEEEIAAVSLKDIKRNTESIFQTDETIREYPSQEDMAALPAAFRKNGSVTAGNSCGLSDGASAILLMTRSKADELRIPILFSIQSYAQCAVAPEIMGIGPAYSIPLALKKVGMQMTDMDIFEINEAFAVQIIHNQRSLNIPDSKLNVNGGAIALGHPIGISGARILVTAYYALKQRNQEFAAASICGGGGVTTAMIIKREA